MADKNRSRKARNSKKNPARKGVSLPVVIILAIVLIGVCLWIGIRIGSNTSKTPSTNVEVVNVESVPIEGTPEEGSDDIFAQESNGENEAALADLAGDSEDTAAILQGDVAAFEGNLNTADDTTVVAEYDGGKLYRGEVAENYNDQLATFLFAGYTEEEISKQLLQVVMEDMITTRILETKAREMGCYDLTDEEKAKAEQEASTNYAEQVSFYIDFIREDGMTDQEAEAEAEQFLKDNEGITFEGLYNETVESLWKNKLYEKVTSDISITEEAVRSYYNDTLSMQETSYSESAENFEMDQLNGAVILYNPEGYRAVKIINFYVEDDAMIEMMEIEEQLEGLDETADAGKIAELNAAKDSAYTGCTERAQTALNELKSGTDFDAAYLKYSEDQEYTPDTIKSTGYYISASSVLYDEETIKAAMALAKPGDISEIIRTESGVSILKYVSDVTPGPVPFEQVRDALETIVLADTKDTEFEAKSAEWLAAVNPVYYPDRMY